MPTTASVLYQARYGGAPTLVLRSPGRINLIGDHTDYCGLPVLPMAIDQAIQFAATARPEPGIGAVSTLDDSVVDSRQTMQRNGWARYVLAVHDQLAPSAPGLGASLAIGSDLPSTGGLSSSSALSVGCAVVLGELWDLGLSADDVIATAVAAERSVAIAGGAMDQTVITRARPGHALRIDFNPESHRHVAVPAGFKLIAGYSGTRASKGGSAGVAYNSFVLASRAAAAFLGKVLNRPVGDPPSLSKVRDVPADLVADLPTVPAREAVALTGGADLGVDAERPLDLRKSAEHVLSEATRVDDAEAALVAADEAALGRLMDESHSSLRRYGSSTAALDKLVEAAREAGASGARVTGAGFGGWAIALASSDRAEAVAAAMSRACGGPTFIARAAGGALWSLHGR